MRRVWYADLTPMEALAALYSDPPPVTDRTDRVVAIDDVKGMFAQTGYAHLDKETSLSGLSRSYSTSAIIQTLALLPSMSRSSGELREISSVRRRGCGWSTSKNPGKTISLGVGQPETECFMAVIANRV